MGPSCPSLEEWGRYEGGRYAEDKAARMLAHASECESCGEMLADMHAGEADAGARGPIVALRSNTPEWKREMLSRIRADLAEQHFASRSRRMPLWVTPRVWAFAAAAVILLGVGLRWNAINNSPEKALQLIAQAYTQDRPFELRIPGAEHAPLSAVRGASNSPVASLLNAQVLISENLKKKSADPNWLLANAGAELLQSHYAAAIDSLRLIPESPDVLGNLGIAYLQRADVESRPQDVSAAIDYLSKAVEGAPSNAVFQFNLALAYERQQTLRQAMDEWNKFLKLEPSGPWADEAKGRLEKVKEQIKEQENRAKIKIPRSSEGKIFALFDEGFRSTPELDASSIAADLAENHRDPWLRDLLKASGSSGNEATLKLLKEMAAAFNGGYPDRIVDRSRLAMETFRRDRNEPGLLFAAYQLTYGLQRLSQPEDCLLEADDAVAKAKKKGYLWIELQLQLNRVSCSSMQRRYDLAYQAALDVQARAEGAGFENLKSRSFLSQAETLRTMGSYREAIKLDAEGLQRYRAGAGSLTLAYQLFYNMGMSTAGLQHRSAADALLKETAEMATLLPDRSAEAMARSRWAEALLDGRVGEAGQQLDRAEELMRAAPPSRAKLLYGFYIGLTRARFDGQQGQAEKTLDRLGLMESQLGPLKSTTIQAMLLGAKSELLTKAGRTEDSGEQLRRLLDLGASTRDRSAGIGDPSVIAQGVSRAVNTLADFYVQRGDPKESWRVWTEFNPCFRTIPADTPGAVRLLFAELPSGIAVWISHPNGTSVQTLPVSSPELRRLAENFHRAVANRGESLDRIRELAKQLYGKVMAPIEQQLQQLSGIKTLYIAADGPFASIPFAALVSPDGRWLAERYTVVYSPPLAGVSKTATPGLGTNPRAVVAGYGRAAKVFQSDLRSLPDVEADMTAIARALKNPKVLKNDEATLSALHAALPGAAIFHFSGHAIVTAGDAALVLAPKDSSDPERLLWASQIAPEDLRSCRLVMLAACSTGRAASEDNDPSSAMARAFLLTGVPEVIASRWDVDSQATSVLVDTFYKAIAGGATTDVALASSIQQLRRQPAFDHPYYWAAFNLFKS